MWGLQEEMCILPTFHVDLHIGKLIFVQLLLDPHCQDRREFLACGIGVTSTIILMWAESFVHLNRWAELDLVTAGLAKRGNFGGKTGRGCGGFQTWWIVQRKRGFWGWTQVKWLIVLIRSHSWLTLRSWRQRLGWKCNCSLVLYVFFS